MPFDEERPFSASREPTNQVWKIALGVALGVALVGLIGFAVRMYFVNQAVKQFNDSMLQINQQTQRSIEVQRQRAAELQQAGLDAAARERADKAAGQRQAALEQQQVADEIRRREAAWARFYTKPAACDKAEGQVFMDCANGHIRAKREFEDRYAKGAL